MRKIREEVERLDPILNEDWALYGKTNDHYDEELSLVLNATFHRAVEAARMDRRVLQPYELEGVKKCAEKGCVYGTHTKSKWCYFHTKQHSNLVPGRNDNVSIACIPMSERAVRDGAGLKHCIHDMVEGTCSICNGTA